jgi:WhiB family transcriptional regulator, redox-sensing transcriptional regulator
VNTSAARTAGWRDLAACRDTPADLFFPEVPSNTDAGARQVAEARAVCRSCQVAPDCLRFAIGTRQAHGVWAGTTEADRAAARLNLTRGAA